MLNVVLRYTRGCEPSADTPRNMWLANCCFADGSSGGEFPSGYDDYPVPALAWLLLVRNSRGFPDLHSKIQA
jgi:hypothetical protein